MLNNKFFRYYVSLRTKKLNLLWTCSNMTSPSKLVRSLPFIVTLILLLVPCFSWGKNGFSSSRSGLDKKLYDGLTHPNLCHLKLVCTVAKLENEKLKQSEFMRGIKTLSVLRKNYKAFQLANALKIGNF